jgi:hypothetical protein
MCARRPGLREEVLVALQDVIGSERRGDVPARAQPSGYVIAADPRAGMLSP